MNLLPGHNSRTSSGNRLKTWKSHIVMFTTGMLFLVGIPYIHIGIINRWFWVPYKIGRVDKGQCSCSCFDTIFRGSYENSVSGYKSVYFNSTWPTLQIWILTVGSLLVSYETIRYIVKLFSQGAVRWTWFILFAASVYPHYYGIWNYFNYINEAFFFQWYHQLLFTVTELIATAVVLNMCDTNEAVTSAKLLTVLCISVMHVIVAGIDQFVANVFRGQGFAFQVFRDMGLTPPDILNIAVCLYQLTKIQKEPGFNLRKELPYAGIFMVVFYVVSKML